MSALTEQIAALEQTIARLENNPDNVIGGLKAWNSGMQTTLKPAAQRKLDKLNAELDTLYDQCEA
jgi:exonuclease VII small subunit